MSKVLCFGEALIDFLRTGGVEEDSVLLNEFTQYPGGAPANAAVAVAKLGGDAAFVGQVGQDMFGDFLLQALSHYSVDTRYVIQHPSLKTALAFVARDANGERQFSFYRDNSADLGFCANDIDRSMFDDAKVFHFCSNTLTEDEITLATRHMIELAKSAGVLITFDVNLRHNLWVDGEANIERVNDFVRMANVLKFSREEIVYLTDDIDTYVQSLLQGEAQLVVITNDGEPISYYSRHIQGQTVAPKVKVVDTTAGGDGFSGGLLYLLSVIDDIDKVLATPKCLGELISFAAACGGHAVTKPGAFPALPTLQDVGVSLPKFIPAEK